MALEAGLVAADVHLFRIGELDLGPLDVHRHVNQHRPLTACSGDVKGFLENAGELPGVFYQIAVLDKGLAGAGDVGLLEHVPAQEAAFHLAGDDHQGNRVHVGGGDAGDQVERAGAGGGDADRRTAGQAGVARGRVGGVLLLPHEDVPDPCAGQRIVKGADSRSRKAKNDLNRFFQ